MSEIDVSEIEKCMIGENTILQLLFPEQGLLHLRVLNIEEVPFHYVTLNTIQPASTDVSSAQRLSFPGVTDIENAIEIKENLHMYQMFFGISPGIIRVRVGYPIESLTKALDVRNNQVTGNFGFVDGYRSPISKPSKMSEYIIPPDFDLGFVFENPDTVPIKPLIYFHLLRMRMQVIVNSTLIYNIMAGKMPAGYVKKKTMGGLSNFKYHPNETYGVDFVNFDVQDLIDMAESSGDMTYKAQAIASIKESLGTAERVRRITPPSMY